jgi:hypothetical protein
VGQDLEDYYRKFIKDEDFEITDWMRRNPEENRGDLNLTEEEVLLKIKVEQIFEDVKEMQFKALTLDYEIQKFEMKFENETAEEKNEMDVPIENIENTRRQLEEIEKLLKIPA